MGAPSRFREPGKTEQEYLNELRKRYSKASKKERTIILDEFVATSQYHRKHAIALLRGHRGWRQSATPLHRLGQVRQLNALYDLCSLYTNHFLPVTKLIAKQREGVASGASLMLPKRLTNASSIPQR